MTDASPIAVELVAFEQFLEKEMEPRGKEILRSFIERVERLTEQKKSLTEDINQVFAEAKGTGFDTKIMKKVIALRAMDPDDRKEQEYILDTYLSALGMNGEDNV